MSLRHESHQALNITWLVLGLTTGFWTLFYKFVGDRMIMTVIPQAAKARVEQKKKENSDLEQMCRINGTAFCHALMIAPPMFFTLWKLRHDKVDGESFVFHSLAMLVTGYFMWDSWMCIYKFKQYGLSFLIHAALCLSCMLLYLTADSHKSCGMLAGIMASECSTIFLHIRWFLITGEFTHTVQFQLANVGFLIAFLFYRMYYVVVNIVIPYSSFVLNAQNRAGINSLDAFRLWFQFAQAWLWVALQYYWGFLMFKSQFGQLKRRFKKSD